jgi:protein-S-isoprenylcysteine O-methyltransferase Ste14
MKATRFEFRFRFLIFLLIYLLCFSAPWNSFLHFDQRPIWVFLAVWAARGMFQAATHTLLVLGLLLTLAAAALRTWGSAYLGTGVVHTGAMHGDEVMAAGPYRYVRNPLYIGTFLNALALSLLMSPSGAIVCIVLVGLFQLRLIGAEEVFLTAKLGEPYVVYLGRVPRLIPALTPRLAASSQPAHWLGGFLGEIYMWGAAITFGVAVYLAVADGRYDTMLIVRGIIISLGVSIVTRAFLPKNNRLR